MPEPSGQQLNRRASSAACSSPTATHAYRDSVNHGESSPVAVRKARQPPVTTSNESQEHETPIFDSALDSNTPQSTSSTFATLELSPCLEPSWPQPTPADEMSDQEILYEIYNYILTMMEPNGADISHYYETATRQPPITTESLQELDMQRIINNPKLRHDVNFDRELHFRPNLDGSKGRQKMKSADQYWLALEGELFMYGMAAQQKAQAPNAEEEAYWKRVLTLSQRRLRQIFEAVRDILKTLVPDHEQKRVAARLDVDLIMQEIMNGVCDLIDLSNWLAKVLKAHCAPMRDELVDAMQTDIKTGAMEGKQDKLVSGLRKLLGILESMKLDVANHQIRHMRPLLVDDTINFQRRYNAHRVAVGKVNVPRCQKWLADEMERLTASAVREERPEPTHLEALTSALVNDVMFNDAQPWPQTFYLDAERLRFLRSDIRSTISHELCREVLAELCPPWVGRAELLKAQAALHCSVSAIVGMSGRFQDRVENIAVEIVRILLVLEGRYPPFDGSMLGIVEQKLEHALKVTSPPFELLARNTVERVLPKLKTSIEEHVKMSALDMQSLVPPTPSHLPPPPAIGFGAVLSAPTQPVRLYDPDEDIVRRFTHLICLHWHVWAELVYLAPAYEPSLIDLLQPSASAPSPPATIASTTSSPHQSPTMPIAQAIYSPGKQWLPSGVTVTEKPVGMLTPATTPEPTMQHQTAPPPYQQLPPEPRRQSKGDCSSEDGHNNEHEAQDGQQEQPA